MKKRTRIIALLLALIMSICLLAGCSNKEETESPAETSEAEATQSESTDETPLVVAFRNFSEKFSPFFATSGYDATLVRIVCDELITYDRAGGIVYNAIEGETIEYNGVEYEYTGMMNLKIERSDDTTTYIMTLRDDIYASDGVQLTADDLIFNYYVVLDSTYDGNNTMSSLDIVGYKNYIYNSSLAEDVTVTEDQIASELADPSDEVASQLKALVESVLDEEFKMCEESWEENSEKYGVKSGIEFFITLYGDESIDYSSMSDDEVLSAVKESYGYDYKALAEVYAGDVTYFDEDVQGYANEYLMEQAVKELGGDEVDYITGIEKIDDYSVSVTVNGFDAAAVYKMDCDYGLAPLHYYGDADAYDYDNHNFGFTRGDLSSIKEKTTHPLGAGQYSFVEYKNGVAYLEANPYYYKGEAATKYVQMRETQEGDMIETITTGAADIANPTYSLENSQQIASYNSNGDVNGDVISISPYDYRGYGYIGINSNNVNVAGETGSDASKNLRKAFATVLAVYRDVTVNSFYGDTAAVINYPISNTSWAAPLKSDSDYTVAYSKSLDGSDLYTSDMSEQERYDAAIEAALEYFEAAGYTVADGKITAAPEGARLEYEVYIAGYGKGDHPTFAVLTNAKAALETIGITLTINDPQDPNLMWNALDGDTQDMWCASWNADVDPDMYQLYHSDNLMGKTGSTGSNYYNIGDSELDELIMEGRSSDDENYRKSIYKAAMEIILDWGVEIPIYQRQEAYIYSTERIAEGTFPSDINSNYDWYRELSKISLS